MPRELKSYNINGHTVGIWLDNVFCIPFFVVRLDGSERFAGKDRSEAIEAFDDACRAAREGL